MNLEIIAILESCYKEKFGTPRQGVLSPESRAIVKMTKPFSDFSFIEDLKLFSHIWLIGGFHLSQSSKHSKIRVPRMVGGRLSVFATRSPHRPNPLSLTLVKIHEIQPMHIYISGVDLIDQTPIYDIKPYLPDYDLCSDAVSHLEVKNTQMNVCFSSEAQIKLNEIKKEFPERKLRSLIIQSLSHDPRPLAYLEKYPERTYGLCLYDYNIQFCYNDDGITVVSISNLR